MNESPWITKNEAAARARVTIRTFDNWVYDGRITAYRVGPRSVRFRSEDVDALFTPVDRDEANR